ncbi:Uma2 family endonuclease [Emticicia sp. SJ17W-69]|uniref:Uma2 family endonuclease n=1 Tax=Emticicia sp. SJ17W-69 TaxID=3421657 RepID=UPI003EC0005D
MTAFLEQTDVEAEYLLDRGKPVPSKNHSRLESRLSFLMTRDYENTYDTFVELSLELSTGKATPDLCLFKPEPSDWLEDEIRVKNTPLGVIEIVSPKQSTQDLVDKLDTYFGAGVQSCWIVIPTFKMINIFHAKHEYKTYMTGELFDEKLGIRLNLEEVFK